ncbi:MAG TPA: nickel-dependent hydrogenase large subunit [Steroidobacteraceae bacterium]|nr:nickel-dependent hydrogenase large subunit [Steroidobacteraceae bacterium]
MTAPHPAPRLEDIAVADLRARCTTAVASGQRMQMAYAWFPEATAPELRYVVHSGTDPLAVWRCRPGSRPVPSLATIAPLLSWYEREITDLCGLSFEGAPDPAPLVLLPGAEFKTPPLRPGVAPPVTYTPMPPTLPEVSGPVSRDVQTLPFGPIRADVLESAQFDYYYLGEAIVHYHPQLFFKHRGMEKRFEGQPPDLGVILAERVSGVGSVAHALAYTQAVEAAAGCEVPPRARHLRMILAELERLYNHLHYLGHLCHTTTLKVGEAEGKYLEERAKQINGRATGHRLLRGLIGLGGLRRAPDLSGVHASLQELREELTQYDSRLEASTTHLDRLITTGILSRQLAFDQGATGPIERASGLDRDLRRDQPYAGYAEMPLKVPTRESGDAHARQQVRIAEAHHSIELIQQATEALPDGPIRSRCVPSANTEGLGWAESPRGSLYYAVHFDARGRLARVKIKSPSYSNWRVFAFTVHDSNMMDYAINEASFGLTMAGCDR